MYQVEKVNIKTEQSFNYGAMPDYKEAIPKGYTFNGLFWERKNGKYIYIVTEIKED